MCCDLPSLRARYLLHLSMSYHKFQLTSRGHLPLETGMSNPLLPLLLAGLVLLSPCLSEYSDVEAVKAAAFEEQETSFGQATGNRPLH